MGKESMRVGSMRVGNAIHQKSVKKNLWPVSGLSRFISHISTASHSSCL
jgi:hypothetical protein